MISRPTTDDRRPTILRYIFILLLVVSGWLFVSAPLGAQAQTVDLLWQGETYAPPFYKGKTLWSSQSSIIFLAMPHGAGIENPANLTYKWTKNGTVLGNVNGVGKNTISFIDSILSRPQTIRIEVLFGQNIVLASASVTVTPISPILAIYENHPLYGLMFHQETRGIHKLQNKEVTFTAFPLFFSALNRSDNTVNYEWRANVDADAETRNSVTYRAPDDAAGSSQIEVRVSNKDKILQSASQSFLIEFGK